MRKIQEISLLSLALPILFSGCVEEISTIAPVKSPEVKSVTKEKQVELPVTYVGINEEISNFLENYEKERTEEKFQVDEAFPSEAKISPVDSSPVETTVVSISPLYENPILSTLIKQNNDKKLSTFEKLLQPALNVSNDWKEQNKEDDVIQTAEQFLGVKYVWAANGPSAFDCSGFTKYVFKENGVDLPRHSGTQATIGQKVAFSELKKGDLVFFDTSKNTKKKKVNHVGIYIGNHQFIHASSAGKKVMITSFDEKTFYKKKFLYARRVLNSPQNLAMN